LRNLFPFGAKENTYGQTAENEIEIIMADEDEVKRLSEEFDPERNNPNGNEDQTGVAAREVSRNVGGGRREEKRDEREERQRKKRDDKGSPGNPKPRDDGD